MSLLDLRHVLRGLRRTPLFTSVTLATLALAIGANTAVFSLVDQALMRPLPYPQPERLVAVWADMRAHGFPRTEWTNPADFADWREQTRTIDEMAAFTGFRPALTGFGDARQVFGGAVTHAFFDVFTLRMQLGRGFTAAEDLPNGPDVAIVSHAFWQNTLNGDPGVLQRTLTLDGAPHSIIGVLPAGFSFPFLPATEVWTPLQAERDGRGNAFIRVVGRLAPGATLDAAASDMDTVAARLAAEYPDSNRDAGIYVQPLQEAVVEGARLRLLVLWAAVGFVLLIACVNIANLLLVRAVGRMRELAIRGSLGASRGRLTSLVVLESVVLTVGGALLGLAVARVTVQLLHARLPDGIAGIVAPAIDLRVFVVTLAAGMVTGLLFGLIPGIRAGRADAAATLRGGERRGRTPAPARMRNLLVVANFALALALTLGAGLFARSLLKLESVDPGFRVDGVLTATITLPRSSYADADALRAFQDSLAERLSALPGVTAAGFTHSLPLADTNTDTSVFIEGRPTSRQDGSAHVWYSIATPGYFEALHIDATEGRVFSPDTRSVDQAGMVVNEAFVREYLDGGEAVGLRVSAQGADGDEWLTIVGVVDDVRFFGVDQRQTPAVYLSMQRFPQRRLFITLAALGNPNLLAGPLRDVVASLDPGIALDDVQPMSALVDASLQPARTTATLVSVFAAAALLIAVIGVYGAISYSAAQRRREFGMRMALGATAVSVLALVLRQGVLLASAGVLLGLAITAALSRSVGSLLYEVSPLDPLVFAGVAGLLLAVALAATAVPAWRAARTQPMRVLREE